MYKKFLTAAFCVLLSLHPLIAGETVTLTVEQAVDQAIKNSRTLKSAAIDLQINKLTRDTVWGYFFPSVNAGGALTRQNKYSNSMSSILGVIPGLNYKEPSVTEGDHWAASGSLSIGLTLTASLVNNIRSAYTNYEAGLFTWEQTLNQTERDVRKMFYGILFMQENLKLQKILLENANQRWKQAQINFRNGLVPELTVLQSQVAYESKKPVILEIEQNIYQQLSLFAFLLGYTYGTEVTLDGTIMPTYYELNTDELIAQYAEKNLGVLSLNKNMETMKLQLTASKMGTYIPLLTFNYALSPSLSPINNSWLEGKNWNDRGNFSVSLSWNLANMLPFSSNMVSIKTKKKNLDQMVLNLDSARENLELEINTLVNTLNKSRSSIEVQKLNVAVARKAYNLTVEAFNAGTKELLDVRDAETQYNQTQLGILQEELNYITALLDLEYALNTKFSTGI